MPRPTLPQSRKHLKATSTVKGWREHWCISSRTISMISSANKLIANETSPLWHFVWNEAAVVCLGESQHTQLAAVHVDSDSWQHVAALMLTLSTAQPNGKHCHRQQRYIFIDFLCFVDQHMQAFASSLQLVTADYIRWARLRLTMQNWAREVIKRRWELTG